VDGTGRTQLTTSEFDDGRIVFTSSRDGNDEIYIMNADGAGQTRLTTTDANEATGSPF
jgi:Tol biopolymer transport system component